MNILILLIFISVVLVFGSVILFSVAVSNGDMERPDQISLLPLEDDENGKTTNHV